MLIGKLWGVGLRLVGSADAVVLVSARAATH